MTTTTWKNTAGGDWNTAADWTNGVPMAGDTALVTTPGSYTIVSDQNNSAGVLQMAADIELNIDTNELDFLTSGSGTGHWPASYR